MRILGIACEDEVQSNDTGGLLFLLSLQDITLKEVLPARFIRGSMCTFTVETGDVAGTSVTLMALGATVTTSIQLLATVLGHMSKLLTLEALAGPLQVFIDKFRVPVGQSDNLGQ